MATAKNGEMNWTDEVAGGKKSGGGGKDTFMRLSQGSNLIRVLTLPHAYLQHRWNPGTPGSKKYGYRINCSSGNPGNPNACPLCEKGDKPKRRWFLGVIDRKTNMYKVLDIGYGVFKSIQNYARDAEWGNPSNYDIDVIQDNLAGPMGYYTAVCKPPKPLTAADLQIQQENDIEGIAKRSMAPTYEKVVEKLRAIEEEIAHSSNQTDDSPSGLETAVSSTEEDDDNFFKDYDKTKKASF